MKRKKWSEVEEETLLSKYSELLDSGSLAKLKTREKKFKPITEYVNAVHHLRDPITFPVKWFWRDVSIKVQNMRHQYLGVKQKIRASDGEFDWKDGENHWENFLKYKHIFGDVQLEFKDNTKRSISGDGGLYDGLDVDCEGFDGGEEDGSRSEDLGSAQEKKRIKKRRGLSFLGGQLRELRDSMVRRDEWRSERDFIWEEKLTWREDNRRGKEELREKRERDAGEEGLVMREVELEEMQIMWARRDKDREWRLEREVAEERQWRMKMEEKREEEEELHWRERLVSMQIQHDKHMIQMQASACQNQLQILRVTARFMFQFFGSATDGLSAGLRGALPPHVLHHTTHNAKPHSNSSSQFL